MPCIKLGIITGQWRRMKCFCLMVSHMIERGRNMPKRLLKHSKEEIIYAPINGKVVKLEDVPDPVFSEKMMGEGIAIIPDKGEVVSPVYGEVVQISETRHAIGLVAIDGTEILIHIGLETVALKGEGFTVHVNVGDKVSTGQKLIDVDLDYIQEHGTKSITPIIITNSNSSNKSYALTEEKEAKAGETVLITIKG